MPIRSFTKTLLKDNKVWFFFAIFKTKTSVTIRSSAILCVGTHSLTIRIERILSWATLFLAFGHNSPISLTQHLRNYRDFSFPIIFLTF